MTVHAVIIDLDGTLLDTATALANAVNLMLTDLGRQALPEATIATFVGKGAEVLVHRALGGHVDARAEPALHERGLNAFYRHYEVQNGLTAKAYEGVHEGLEAMRAAGLKLVCVTNKPPRYADSLPDRCGMAGRSEFVVGGRPCPTQKPDSLHTAR